jgi:poly-gamma-glutamate synthesis protein (capsule biosynthesis protein)
MVHDRQLETAYVAETNMYKSSHFDYVEEYLRDADYTIGNLETTFAGADAGQGTYPLFNTPDEFADCIKDSGFTFLTTANNHCYDKRSAGLIRTLEILDGRGIPHTGTFASEEDSNTTFITRVNNIDIALLSFTYSTNGIPVDNERLWLVNLLDEELMLRRIEQARADGAELVIVLPHMGNEYEESPPETYRSLAHKLCEWGADAVMANHPHVLQPTEYFTVTDDDGSERVCFVAYSMGNFVSGQRTVPRDVGAVFYLEYEKTVRGEDEKIKLVSASFVPTWVRFNDARGRYDIKVLPVYDALRAVEKGEEHNIRPQDINRLKEAHSQTSKKMLGTALPLEDIRMEYKLFPREDPEE